MGTLDLVRVWEDAAGVSVSTMRKVLAAIEERGYVPGAAHPHFGWWQMWR